MEISTKCWHSLETMTLPQDCICVPWCEIDSFPEYLIDKEFELRAEKKVENDVINERFEKIEKQNGDIGTLLNELKSSVNA